MIVFGDELSGGSRHRAVPRLGNRQLGGISSTNRMLIGCAKDAILRRSNPEFVGHFDDSSCRRHPVLTDVIRDRLGLFIR